MKKFFIIDGNGYIHRAFHALPFMATSFGFPTNALYGFTRMLLKIINKENPEYLVVCFDRPEATFRHKKFKEYKAKRPEADESLKQQLKEAPLIPEALGIKYLTEVGFEADDIIAGIVKKFKDKDIQFYIVSGDKDTYQLIDENVFIYNDMKDIVIGKKNIKKIFGVSEDKIVDYLALVGDSSDNVPGVRGIGPKTAAKLLEKFNSLNEIYRRIQEIEEKTREKLLKEKENAFFSLNLVKLKPVEIKYSLEDFLYRGINREKAKEVFKKFEFKSFLKDFLSEIKYEGDGKILKDRAEMEDVVKEMEVLNEIYIIYHQKENREIFGIKAKNEYLIEFGGELFSNITKKDFKIFKNIFEDERIKKSSTDLKEIYKFLKKIGIELKGLYFDLKVCSYLLDPAKSAEDVQVFFEENLGGKISVEDETEKVFLYLKKLPEIKEKILEKLNQQKLIELYFKMELPLIEILSLMEERGIKVDLNFLKEFKEKILKETEKIQKRILDFTGKDCNINSPKQLAFVLFEKLKLPVIKKGKSYPSTSEEVLKELSNTHPLPDLILKYRELQKLSSTYIIPLIESADENSRVHPKFNQTVAQTGRLSSSEPNLQNIPVRGEVAKEIRKAFIPEKGFRFVSFDYSQIDLRVLAHFSNDKNLIQTFKNNGDVHTETAKEIFGKKEIDKSERRIAKTVNFGIVYGMSPFGLSRDLGISKEESKKYIERYFKKYEGVKEYIQRTIREARIKGYVETLFGRKRYVKDIGPKDEKFEFGVSSYGARIAINTPIQGTSADIIKLAMVEIYKFIKKEKLNVYLLLQIHDELLFEIDENLGKDVMEKIKEIMEGCVKLKVPIKVEYKIGYNWYEME